MASILHIRWRYGWVIRKVLAFSAGYRATDDIEEEEKKRRSLT